MYLLWCSLCKSFFPSIRPLSIKKRKYYTVRWDSRQARKRKRDNEGASTNYRCLGGYVPVFIFYTVFNFCDSISYFLYFYYFIVVLFLLLLLPSPHYDLKTSFFKFSFVCYSFLFSIIFAQFVFIFSLDFKQQRFRRNSRRINSSRFSIQKCYNFSVFRT